jgi:DNA-binding PadR family transcriptional regulator
MQSPHGRSPLRPAALALLFALSSGPLTGVEVMSVANGTLASGRLLGPGTLYRVLRELRQAGLIERVTVERPAADDRLTHHELTALGRRVFVAERDRLERTLALGQRRRLKAVPR